MLPKEILHDPRFHFDINAEKHLRTKPLGTFLFRACEDNNSCIVLCYSVPDHDLSALKVIKHHRYKVIFENEKFKIVSTGKKNKTYKNLDEIIASINTRKIKLVTPLFIEELFPVQIPLPPEIVKRADFHPNVTAEESLKNSTEQKYLFKKCRTTGYIVLVIIKNSGLNYYYFRWASKTTLLYQMNLENLCSDTLETFTSINEIIDKFKLTKPLHFDSQLIDPLQWVIPSTEIPISAEIIQHILRFLSSVDFLNAYHVSKHWLEIIKHLMEKELNRTPDGKLDATNPLKLNETKIWPYFFAMNQISNLPTRTVAEKKIKIAETLHRYLMQAIEKACETGDDQKLEKLLKKAINLNVRLIWEETVAIPSEFQPRLFYKASTRALHLAAAGGYAKCIELLIAYGAMPNRLGSDVCNPKFLMTALFLAENNLHVNAVFSLLACGARATNARQFVDITGYKHIHHSIELNSQTADKVSQINNLKHAKIHIENAELKFIENYNEKKPPEAGRMYLLQELSNSYSDAPELFINIMLKILEKKLMYNPDYFNLGLHNRQIYPAHLIKIFINELCLVLDNLNIKNSELQLALAKHHKAQKNPPQALKNINNPDAPPEKTSLCTLS